MPVIADVYKLAELKSLVRKSMTEYRSAAPDLYRGAASGLGYGTLDKGVEQFIRLALIESTLPYVPNKSDPHPEITPLDPVALTVEGKTYRAMMTYYWEDAVDDKWGYWADQAREFGKSIERTVELLAHEPFINALNPAYTSGWDAQPLGSTTHQLQGGGTYDNTLPAQPPSEALLEQILDYFARVPSEYGFPQMVRRVTGITNDRYARRWRQILGSPTAISHPFNPATVANQNPSIPNLVAQSDRVDVIVAPYLTGNIQIVTGEGHELFFKRRWQYDEMEELKNPRAIRHYAGVRLFTGWLDARRVLVIGT